MIDHISHRADSRPFLLAHISDLHLAEPGKVHFRQLMNKRFLGYTRWKLIRHLRQDSSLADILINDFHNVGPDHTVITGDITHLGLPCEFRSSAQWLHKLGTGKEISLVPGNHDSYVFEPWQKSFIYWMEYLLPGNTSSGHAALHSLNDIFPSVEIIGHIALIGLSTSVPCSLRLATGTLGYSQLKKLEAILKQLQGQRLFRVIFLHHPPVHGVVKKRKCLTDADRFLEIIKKYGCDLILHGHAHREVKTSVKTPQGTAPVFGAPSVTSLDPRPDKRAAWYIHEISEDKDGFFSINTRKRVFMPEKREFQELSQEKKM